jgi:hypothetical protein
MLRPSAASAAAVIPCEAGLGQPCTGPL